MIEFYKYLYAGGHDPHPAPTTNIKNISKKWEIQTNVSSCPSPVVQLTSHLSMEMGFLRSLDSNRDHIKMK